MFTATAEATLPPLRSCQVLKVAMSTACSACSKTLGANWFVCNNCTEPLCSACSKSHTSALCGGGPTVFTRVFEDGRLFDPAKIPAMFGLATATFISQGHIPDDRLEELSSAGAWLKCGHYITYGKTPGDLFAPLGICVRGTRAPVVQHVNDWRVCELHQKARGAYKPLVPDCESVVSETDNMDGHFTAVELCALSTVAVAAMYGVFKSAGGNIREALTTRCAGCGVGHCGMPVSKTPFPPGLADCITSADDGTCCKSMYSAVLAAVSIVAGGLGVQAGVLGGRLVRTNPRDTFLLIYVEQQIVMYAKAKTASEFVAMAQQRHRTYFLSGLQGSCAADPRV